MIISEREGSENSPTFWLHEETRAAAFRVHPYHHQVLGDMDDLRSMTRDDLYQHYRTYYNPNNAIAVAVGDFDAGQMLERIEAHYGGIPRGPEPPPVTRREPPQRGERTVRVEREGNAAHVYVGYRAPAATDPTGLRLALVDSILVGASAPGGNGIGNRTSRLYRALVETELATGVGGGPYPSVDPYLFSVMATVRDGRAPDEVQAALDAEIERIAAGDVSQEELDKAPAGQGPVRLRHRACHRPGVLAGFLENFSDHTWYEHYLDHLAAVTLDDVREAAGYLRRSQRTVGWFIPVNGTAQEGTPA